MKHRVHFSLTNDSSSLLSVEQRRKRRVLTSVSISWRTEATCSPPRRRASHSAGSHLLGSSPREAGDAMGSGTLGAAARQMRVAEREGGRGASWEEGLPGKETTAQEEAGESERAGERPRTAMGFPLLGWSSREDEERFRGFIAIRAREERAF